MTRPARYLRPCCNNHNRLDSDGFARMARLAMTGEDFSPSLPRQKPSQGITAHLMRNIYEHAYLDGAWEMRRKIMPRWLISTLDVLGFEFHQLRDHEGYGAEEGVISRHYRRSPP